MTRGPMDDIPAGDLTDEQFEHFAAQRRAKQLQEPHPSWEEESERLTEQADIHTCRLLDLRHRAVATAEWLHCLGYSRSFIVEYVWQHLVELGLSELEAISLADEGAEGVPA